ncbi:helix-turn-helix domain-containing protein [Streptomyces koyangensis]|uniref:helix-turn-helix domain-containing protein n=1 Tax=Streptomyces koyangensis TaxID=188770 RepID=UPI003C30E21F
MPAVPRPRPDDEEGSVTRLHVSREAANMLLGEHLRQCREERRLTQTDLAHVIRASVSKISRLERGESPPKPRDVMDLARFMRLSPQDQITIEGLLEQARTSAKYQQFSDVTPHYLKRLIALEANAREIHAYENQVVPGLLQIREYARSLVSTARSDSWEIDRITEMRIWRQQILERPPPRPRLTALIDEGVLLRPRGGKEVMHRQLQHLLDKSDGNKINIRIVPFGAGAEVTPPYAITQLHFDSDGLSDLVYVEHINGANYITDPEEVDRYRRDLGQLQCCAADREESRELIREAMDRYAA